MRYALSLNVRGLGVTTEIGYPGPVTALPELLRQAEAAELLGVSEETLRAWRKLKRGPAWIRYSSRSVRYRRDDLDAWLDENRRDPKEVG